MPQRNKTAKPRPDRQKKLCLFFAPSVIRFLFKKYPICIDKLPVFCYNMFTMHPEVSNMNTSPIPSATAMKYKNARYSLLFIVVLSVVNLFTIVLGEFYFLFSAWVPQQLMVAGYLLAEETGLQSWIWIFGFIGLLTILPYFLCWLFSGKHVGWMIGALAIFAVDSLIFLFDFILYIIDGDFTLLTNLVFRIAAVVLLILGVRYGLQLKKERQAEAIPTAAQADAVFGAADAAADMAANGMYAPTDDAVTRRITVSRSKSFVGMAVAMRIYVNDTEVCRLKNGETQTFSAPCAPFVLGAMFTGGGAAGKTEIQAGSADLHYQASISPGLTVNSILLTPVNDSPNK